MGPGQRSFHDVTRTLFLSDWTRKVSNPAGPSSPKNVGAVQRAEIPQHARRLFLSPHSVFKIPWLARTKALPGRLLNEGQAVLSTRVVAHLGKTGEPESQSVRCHVQGLSGDQVLIASAPGRQRITGAASNQPRPRLTESAWKALKAIKQRTEQLTQEQPLVSVTQEQPLVSAHAHTGEEETVSSLDIVVYTCSLSCSGS